MATFAYDLEDPQHFTVAALTTANGRIWYLQAGRAEVLVTTRIAEGHVEALARAIQAILEDLGRRQPHRFTVLDTTVRDMRLVTPLTPAFRITHVGLGYDEERDRMTLLLQGLQDDTTLVLARLLVSRRRILAWSHHVLRVVSRNSPQCVQRPTPCRFRDGAGRCHYCPERN
jgi:uncharacterized repeat protein (TIGR03847 family)